jgi:hypothetical protein
MALPFAALHQLLRPSLAEADALPPRQRDALLSAFGMTDAAAPKVFLIALAVLNLFSDGATSREPAAVVRRRAVARLRERRRARVRGEALESEPILLLAALRAGASSVLDEVGLDELQLGPL